MNKQIWVAVAISAALLGTGCMGMHDRRDMGATGGSGGMGKGSMSSNGMDNSYMGNSMNGMMTSMPSSPNETQPGLRTGRP